MDTQIIVIGAGVVGLTTALVLKQKGYQHVTVVAKYVPGDMCVEYTSPYAGAHWRTMAKNDDKFLSSLDAVSYEKFMNMVGNTKEKNRDDINQTEMGIMAVPSWDYYDDETVPEYANPWIKDVVYNFRMLTEKDGLPAGAKLGHTYTTVLINSPVYLKWLQNQFTQLGGTIVKRSLSHIDDLFDVVKSSHAAVINCTGLGARFLGGVQDEAVTPTRGQTVVVDAPHIKATITHVRPEGMTYIIPRSDGTVILGGTANKGDFNPYVDDVVAKYIIRRTKSLCPQLDEEPKIVRHAVGLRPSRIGGPRFENEVRRSKDGKKALHVTHAYGHGGYGYQSSWGSAAHTVQLMEKGLPTGKSRL
ncbi:hypothetical protein INT47_007713 [Mucor saturninus]|uniref:FAD dependent oxidoreductase domain-containing protein n=1 Tax=Mucor saturninus TaxID=64648 RepID=A0A8H7QYH5_9FUNG|nr:hypothetical protein INT47_007713 [Mucor saturninus]